MNTLKRFFKELQRRKVITSAIAYVVLAWLLLQVADVLLPIYDVPDAFMRMFSTGLFIGFPVVLCLAWFFNISLDGVVRTMNADPAPQTGGISLPDGPSVAVFPFRNISGEPEQDVFALALSNDIITGLTQSSHLWVLSLGATSDAGDSEADIAAHGRKLNAKYLLRGSVRQAGAQLRVSAHLLETESGMEIWSEKYDRALNADQLFAIQDEIRERIVATLSDLHGVIYSSQAKQVHRRPTEKLEAYEHLAIALEYDKYISPENHLKARENLEKAVVLDPRYDEAWSHLSWIYTDEWVYGFNTLPDAPKRALEAALKGIQLAPDNYHNHWLLSRVYYFNGNLEGFLAESKRALELNARDGTTLGLIGLYTAWSGDWAHGIPMLEKAQKLNPNYPPYYHVAFGTWRYQQQDFRRALEEFTRANLPDWPVNAILLAATHAELGQLEAATRHVESLRKMDAPHEASTVRDYMSNVLPFLPDLVGRLTNHNIWK